MLADSSVLFRLVQFPGCPVWEDWESEGESRELRCAVFPTVA